MKPHRNFVWLVIALWGMTVGWCAPAQTNDVRLLAEEVVVQLLGKDKILPVKEEDLTKFLWDNFANKPEEKRFEKVTNDQWAQKCQIFENALIRKAKQASLDGHSLIKSLRAVREETKGLPVLPVGAYLTSQNGNPAWIIVVKWEALSMSGKPDPMGHVRVFAFDAKSVKLLGGVTCG